MATYVVPVFVIVDFENDFAGRVSTNDVKISFIFNPFQPNVSFHMESSNATLG